MFRNYGYPKSEPENTTTEEGEFGENSYAAIFGRSKIECKPYKGPMPNKTIPAGLRHLKMELKSLIVAKQSCTGQEIEDSYCSLFGYRPQYREFGYKCIDELLAAFPDICKGYIDPSGSKIYIPVVDERHKDLAFQLSRAPRSPSKREHRHPCSNGPDRTSPNRQNIPPISDFRFRQPWLKNRVASTKSIGQFPLPPVPASERLIFKDDGAKCPERCRAITDMVRNIGEKSPDRTETRCHIETLKNHYYHLTGLSLWGKIMHVSDYAEAMDKPDFYKFWRIMNVPSTDGGRAHYMVVPTDPKNNYLYLCKSFSS